MKKLLYDLSVCQPIGGSKYHGAGVYGHIVFKELANKIKSHIVAYFDKNRFMDEDVLKTIKDNNIPVINAKEMTLLEAANLYENCSFYSPLYSPTHNQLLNTPIRGLVTIHGLRNLEMNRDCYEYLYEKNIKGKFKCLLKQTPYYKKLCDKYWLQKKKLFTSDNFDFITISEHSKASICYHYPFVDMERVSVRMSPSSSIGNYKDIKPYSSEKYYLLISAGRWIKNAYRAIKAFESTIERFPMFEGKMYVVGLSKNTEVYKKIKDKSRFVFFDYVDRNTLESLYRGAHTFIYPTLNEGLGDPPIEAIKYGVPVITSTFGAVSEVCGDSVLYVNPYSEKEIAMRILSLEQEQLHNEYSMRGLKRYEMLRKKQDNDLRLLIEDIISML